MVIYVEMGVFNTRCKLQPNQDPADPPRPRRPAQGQGLSQGQEEIWEV